MRKDKGVSLLEILVVITIFAALAIISTRSVFLTLRGTKKSETLRTVRENLDFSIAIMERQLRNAESIVCVPPAPSTQVSYVDKNDITASFSCEDMGAASDGYVSSNSAKLTSSEVDITVCVFVCDPGTASVPPSVTINLTAQAVGATGVEGAEVTLNTKVFLRTY